MNVVVVIPSRGRPEAARLTLEAIRDTAARVSTKVVFAVDADDPELAGYSELLSRPRLGFGVEAWTVTLEGAETGDLVRATNTVSTRVAKVDPHAVIGNLGDDHRPRTPGWDRAILEALEQPGIAYGDDLIQGEKLPTAPFISAPIVRALGWYALPSCRHLYIDDAWRDLGRELGVLRWLPDVVIEHCHPAVGKAEWDDGYRRANAEEVVQHDRAAFRAWRGGRDFDADIANVRRALAVVA